MTVYELQAILKSGKNLRVAKFYGKNQPDPKVTCYIDQDITPVDTSLFNTLRQREKIFCVSKSDAQNIETDPIGEGLVRKTVLSTCEVSIWKAN